MKICICDDEKDFIHNFQLLLKQYSKKHKNINQFNFFENENDLLSYFYSQNDIDILFLIDFNQAVAVFLYVIIAAVFSVAFKVYKV